MACASGLAGSTVQTLPLNNTRSAMPLPDGCARTAPPSIETVTATTNRLRMAPSGGRVTVGSPKVCKVCGESKAPIGLAPGETAGYDCEKANETSPGTHEMALPRGRLAPVLA